MKPTLHSVVCGILAALISPRGAAIDAPKPGSVFRDCPECPEMVVVAAGTFVMGSPEAEEGRRPREGPPRVVNIARPFAVGKFEVTREQYAAFANETGRAAAGSCWYWHLDDGKFVNDDPRKDWRNPGSAQNDAHPVVCVMWTDAKAFAEWLGRKTGKKYRLLTEAEWEYAARAGTNTARYWGNDANQACAYANVQDATMVRMVSPGEGKLWSSPHQCDDGIAYTAPVGNYRPNAFGLHDMLGNVWEWVEDCWNETYASAPTDGSAWATGECGRRVIRGGSWYSDSRIVRSAFRYGDDSDLRYYSLGFRVAWTLP